MSLSSDKLFKIFKLESEFGYENKAVVGGIQKLSDSWAGEARAEGVSEALIPAITSILKHYQFLEPKDRWQALQEIGDLLSIPKIGSLLKPSFNVVAEKREEKKSEHSSKKASEQSTDISVKKKSGQAAKKPREELQTPQGIKPKVSKKAQEISRNPIADTTVGLDAPTSVIRGVGPKQSEHLKRLGLLSIEDLLYFFPRRYDDYSALKTIGQLKFGEEVTIIGRVITIATYPSRRNMKITEAVISDTTGNIRLIWFNQDYHIRYLRKGMFLSISGKVEYYRGRPVITHPDYEPIDQQQLHTNRIVPVYPLTALITQRWLRRTMFNTIDYWSPRISDFLPPRIREEIELPTLQTALKQIHFPDTQADLDQARQRLAFDEIFLLQLGVTKQKSQWQSLDGEIFIVEDDWLQKRIDELPYRLTNAQNQTVNDIRKDLSTGHPMNRLLQGDVGSGKTIVAGLGIAMVVSSGAQAAIMAPTSILAEQHYQSMLKLFCNPDSQEAMLQPDQVRLLIGDTSASDREEILTGLNNGQIKLLIGTHALIEDPVTFDHLQMVVVDEQHRFGVKQRAALRKKGNNPHLLVMTATPIPRSLQLTIFGDLDVSVMDEMPEGRQSIETHILYPLERERAYTLILSQVEKGNQAFVVYPLVEQGEREETKAAVEEQQRLQKEVFPKLKVGLMHGRMRPDEKENSMRAFRNKEYDILVSTSVVEVGVDIPHATVMVIEGANRFGLAQLHQFRGRVGRGSEQSYCILIPETEDSAENERLVAMTDTNDGFLLAEKDLNQRGPGEFLGTRQSGYTDLKMASLSNIHLIEKARRYAQQVFKEDPELVAPEHELMRIAMDHFWPASEGTGDMS
ncbi:MAG: ATP-dependent DNA helicase RecG [Anaerolineaceae bacterium]|nr:ATP-dependent DNA helicase RecG [Anaerolineaceae bacterium]